MHTHAHTFLKWFSRCPALDENKILNEVLSFSRMDARWLRPPPLPFERGASVSPLFSFLLLHFTLALKQLNKTVFAKLLISWKSLGRFGRYEAFFVLYIRALVEKKRPFGFQSQYSERRWKPELCFLRPRPSAVRPITFRPEKSEGDAS